MVEPNMWGREEKRENEKDTDRETDIERLCGPMGPLGNSGS